MVPASPTPQAIRVKTTAGWQDLVLGSGGVSKRALVVTTAQKPTAAAAGAGGLIYEYNGIQLVNLTYVSDGDTNGLIYYLGTRSGAFVSPVPQTAGAIDLVGTTMRLYASSLEPSGYQTYRAVDRDSSASPGMSWASASQANATLSIELYQNRTLKPNRVLHRHRADSPNTALMHFAVEGSNDGTTWTLIRQVDETVAPAAGAWRSWTLSTSTYYRFLRLRMTGLDSGGLQYMVVGEIEWYGELAEGGQIENRFQVSDGLKWYSAATAVELADGTVPSFPGGGGGGGVEIYKQPTEPTAISVGALWIDTDEAPASPGLPTYTTANRPTASAQPGLMIYVSDAGTNQKIQVSDGTAWFAMQLTYLGPWTLTYASAGDTNDMFYWLGTSQGSTGWSNPIPSKITSVGSAPHASSAVNQPLFSTDRNGSTLYHSSDTAGNYLLYDLGTTRRMAVNRYSIQGRNDFNGHYPRNWKLRGSLDNSTWIDIDTRTGDTTIASLGAWGTFVPNGNTSTAFRYLRVEMTGPSSDGNNYLCLAEVQLYGTLS